MDFQELKHRLKVVGSFVTALGTVDEEALIEFASNFGEPAFKRGRPARPSITEVRPRPNFDPVSFAGSDEFRLHTDLSWLPDEQIPRLMFLLCVRPEAEGGGATLHADGWMALGGLSKEQRAELETISVRMRSHRDGIGVTYRDDPLVKATDCGPFIRFRRDLLEGDVPESVTAFGAAVDNVATRFHLKAGQVLVMDNTRMLHGREPLKAGLESDRLLLRMHVK